MSDDLTLAALLRLQTWLSPSFPTGAFTCSHGLESAIVDGTVRDAAELHEWILSVLEHGSGRNDAIVLHRSHVAVTDACPEALVDINELALALSAGAERRRESLLLGASFRRAAAVWFDVTSVGAGTLERADVGDPLEPLGDACALPVAIGALTALAGLPPLAVLASSIQASAANLAWIAARLIPLGQSDVLGVLAALEPRAVELAGRARLATLDDLGGCAVLADIASLRHERVRFRVCRT